MQGVGGKHSFILSPMFFVIGIVAGVGLRIVLIVEHWNYSAAKITWYTAMGLFLIFYLYRYIIELKRRRIVKEHNLSEKIRQQKLEPSDYKYLSQIVDSILISKLKQNFIILFLLTLVAIVVQAVIDAV